MAERPPRHTQRSQSEAAALHAILDVVAFRHSSRRRGRGWFHRLGRFCGIHDGMACLQWVATDPHQRRKGYSQAALSALLSRAQAAGATGACLQVVADTPLPLRSMSV